MRFRRPSPRPESPLPRARISAASFRRPPLRGHSRRTGIPAGVLGHGTQHRGAYHKFSDTDPRAWSSARPMMLVLQKISDRVPIALHRGDMVAQRAAGDAVEVAAFVVIGQSEVGHPNRFPEPHLFAPL